MPKQEIDCERWIEINLDAIVYNYRQIEATLPKGVALCPVVKADAYGHGAVEVAQILARENLALLGVTTLDEAEELRINGLVKTPILVFAPLVPPLAKRAAALNVIPTIDSLDALLAWQKQLDPNKISYYDLKIDTGMSRAGTFLPGALEIIEKTKDLKHIKLHGVYSHLAKASKNSRFTAKQLKKFEEAIKAIKEIYPEKFCAHIAASNAFANWPTSYCDLVRIGTLLYGQKPVGVLPKLDLKDPWQVKARLLTVKEIPAGSKIGYGCEYTAKRKMQVGVIPLGYADGFGLNLQVRRCTLKNVFKEFMRGIKYWLKGRSPYAAYSQSGEVLPVVGRIAMQMAVVDLSNSSLKKPGEIVNISLRRTMANPLLTRVYINRGAILRYRKMAQSDKVFK